MRPICDQCGYDLSATERGDEGSVCPECGKAHQALEGLVLRPWPGWGIALIRMCWHVPVAAGGYALWLLVLPDVVFTAPGLVGVVALLVTVVAVPLFALVGVPWGPVTESRHLAPKHMAADDARPSRARVLTVGLAVNIAVVVALWVTQNQWVLRQITWSMAD